MTQETQRIKLLLTEDLSPHKIALLFLVVLYSQGSIPQSRSRQVLLALIKPLENEPLVNENNEFIVVPQLMDLCRLIENAILSSVNDDDGAQGQDALDAQRDAAHLQKTFLSELWRINSVEYLNTYIKSVFCLLSDPLAVTVPELSGPEPVKKLISPRSFIGDFIQKIVTTFRLLHFDEEFILYEALVDYRESSRELFSSLGGTISHQTHLQSKGSPRKSRLEHFNPTSPLDTNTEQDDALFARLNDQLAESLDINIPTPSQAVSRPNVRLIPVPKHDMQSLLHKQVELLERYGTETPKSLRDIMTLMASPDANTCSIQNANFNNLPSYYYLRYLENLHACDYHGAFQSLHQYFDYMVSKSSKYFYHFALISRASLHQYFGEDEKALDAIEEAISVARENKDNSTLTYILSWLFNFIRHKPELWQSQNFYQNNNESHLLDFLIKKAQTVSPPLYAMSYHFETFHIINSGGPMNKYLESLLKATYISINDDYPTFIKSTELAGTVWNRIGIPHLGDLYVDISFDYAKRVGKLGDEICLDIRKNHLLYYKGQTEKAYKNLELLKPKTKFDMALFKSLQIRSLIILVKIDLRKGRFKYSQEIMNTLLNMEIHDAELKSELIYLSAEVQASLGNYSNALYIISQSLSMMDLQQLKTQTNVHTIIGLNLLKCYIFNEAGVPSRAISLVIQQIEQAKKLGFSGLVSEGMVLLVSIMNNMDNFEDAYKMLDRLMPTVLRVGNQQLICTAYYQYAKSCYHMAKAKQNRLQLSQKALFNNFLKFLYLSITGSRLSLNLVLLRQCFELESQMGDECANFAKDMRDSQPVDEFREHSRVGLKILNKRATEEADYGFIVNYNSIIEED